MIEMVFCSYLIKLLVIYFLRSLYMIIIIVLSTHDTRKSQVHVIQEHFL